MKNYKLLIDAYCPICNFVGNKIENMGLVEKGTCTPYQEIDANIANYVDILRGRNEIALLNTETHQVYYGIDAFGIIATHHLPFLGFLFKFKPFVYIAKFIYKLIALNRRVIAVSKPLENDIAPETNLLFRTIYGLFVVFFSSWILYHYTQPMNQYLKINSSFYRELTICFGQIIWQYVWLHRLIKDKMIDYLGNMLTVSLLGTLALIPILFINKYIYNSLIISVVYFFFVVLFMLLEHIRRCKILELAWLPSFSWVLYRVLVLVIITLLQL